MKLRCVGLALCALVAAGSPAVWAQNAPSPAAPGANAGLIKRVAGLVTLERGGQSQAARPGLALQVGDQLRTGPDGAAGLTLADDTLVSTGPNSVLVINAFSYDSTTQDGNLLLQLWRGTVSVVTGLIARKAPEKVNVQTRTVMLGVRGTEFIVDTEGDAR